MSAIQHAVAANAKPRPAASTDPPSGSTSTRGTAMVGYDEANRVASVTSPTGQRWTHTYDANGNRLTQIDANGNATATAGDGRRLALDAIVTVR